MAAAAVAPDEPKPDIWLPYQLPDEANPREKRKVADADFKGTAEAGGPPIPTGWKRTKQVKAKKVFGIYVPGTAVTLAAVDQAALAAARDDIKAAFWQGGDLLQIAVGAVRQINAVKAIHGNDRGMHRHLAFGGVRDRDGRPHWRAVRGGDIEVGSQRLSNPVGDRLAETADHDRDRGQHRETDDERGDRHRKPGDRRGQVGMRQQAFYPEPAPQRRSPTTTEELEQ